MTKATTGPQAALYCQGTFDIANPTSAQWKQMIAAAKDIGTSGFTTVILGQFHVHSDGSIFYNDSELSTVLDTLQKIPALLKIAGNVKQVLLTFGPFGSDFSAIAANLSSFESTMASVISSSGLDGLDWDLEQSLGDFSQLLVDLNVWATGLGSIVTAAPYYDQSFWVDVQKSSAAQKAGSAWWNLQLYGGAVYSQWVPPLDGVVPDPAAFLYAGYANTQGWTPPQIQAALKSLKGTYAGLTGGFLWRYESIAGSGYSTTQFAQAILAGVS